MRLLVVTNDFPPVIGGIENIVFSLVTRWPPDEVTVLTRWVRGGARFDRRLQFPVEREPVGTLLPTPRLFERVERLVRQRSIDTVYFPTPLPLALMGPRLPMPYAVGIMGADFVLSARLPLLREAARRALSRASVIIPLSSFLEAEATRLLSPAAVPIEVVPPGVDAERFSPSVGPSAIEVGGPAILYLARLVERKGAGVLLRALPRLLDSHPAARVVLVGGGPFRYQAALRQIVFSHRLEKSVIFAGPQRWDQVPAFYAGADLFTMPAHERFGGLDTEGFGMVYLEAAASALPAVAGDVGGVRDAVLDGETGYVVNGADPGAVADAILRLLDDPAKAKLMGERARERVLSEFTWEKVAARFRSAIEAGASG
jgi:phosphatidylinositol alpha-1,6-mannosyltransferase